MRDFFASVTFPITLILGVVLGWIAVNEASEAGWGKVRAALTLTILVLTEVATRRILQAAPIRTKETWRVLLGGLKRRVTDDPTSLRSVLASGGLSLLSRPTKPDQDPDGLPHLLR